MSNEAHQKPSPYDQLYQHELTEFEVAEARNNIVGLYGLLLKIDKRIKQEGQSDDRSNRSSDRAN